MFWRPPLITKKKIIKFWTIKFALFLLAKSSQRAAVFDEDWPWRKKSKKRLGIAIENSTAAGNISSQSGNFEVLGGISHRIAL